MDAGREERRGRMLLERGLFGEALAAFEGALLEKPGDPDLLNGMGAALRSLGRYDEANACFRRSLEADPRDRGSS